jgi:hypothetical protein
VARQARTLSAQNIAEVMFFAPCPASGKMQMQSRSDSAKSLQFACAKLVHMMVQALYPGQALPGETPSEMDHRFVVVDNLLFAKANSR